MTCLVRVYRLNCSYEAVHPVRSLSELKRRLGHGCRCFAFFHPCLPEEPLVFVHVALLPDVASSMEYIRGASGGDLVDGKKKQEYGREFREDDVRSIWLKIVFCLWWVEKMGFTVVLFWFHNNSSLFFMVG